MQPIKLSFRALIGYINQAILQMKDPRQASNGTKYSLSDTLLGAFSLFFMQSASLFDGLKNKRAVNFQTYVRKHRQRIPGYEYYQ